MKAERITWKSTYCRVVEKFENGTEYRVMFSDLPAYLRKIWRKEADGICFGKELKNPRIEMQAVLLPDGSLHDVEFQYYFDDYVYFDLKEKDKDIICNLFTEICREKGHKCPDAYNPETGDFIGDWEWEKLAAQMEETNPKGNIKSKQDVIKALKICSLGDKKREHNCSCEACPYRKYAYNESEYKGTNCDEELMKDVLEYLI